MKVLILDHDGVICLSNNWGGRFKKRREAKEDNIFTKFDNFDIKSVKLLNKIIEKTGCEIVVSSDWRRKVTVEEMGQYYESQGIIKKPIDFTPSINDVTVPEDFDWVRYYDLEQERSLEILDWLRQHPEVTHWVAVDDLYMGVNKEETWGLTNFVNTPLSHEGIKQTGIKEIIIKFLT